MEKDALVFVKQLADSLEQNLLGMQKAKADNDPRAFNDLKKKAFDIQKQLEEILK